MLSHNKDIAGLPELEASGLYVHRQKTLSSSFKVGIVPHLAITLGHINNLYNTTFWAIVHSGKSEQEAEEKLRVCYFYFDIGPGKFCTEESLSGYFFQGQARDLVH
jgi:hypothetical protein